MQKLLLLIKKDFLLLWRDKISLAILFIMPMFFVLTITLLQAQRPGQMQAIPVLILNQDQGNIPAHLEDDLKANGYFNIKLIQGSQINWANKAVSQGEYNLFIIIPANTSKSFTQYTQQSMVTNSPNVTKAHIKLIFDPALNPALQNIIIERISSAIRLYQMQIMSDITSEVIGTTKTNVTQQPLPLDVSYAGSNEQLAPNPVQQNIPAWALFGMFFIALPLASIMIKEREQSVLLRFYIAPIPRVLLIISRMISFIVINFLQLWLMLLVGIFIIPLSGLQALNLSGNISLVMLVGLFSAFAATSFGLLIGAWSKTIEQASALTPILIVLAAAIGGIMIPTYLMPASMQHLAVISPLHWAHQAFIEVLVRHANINQIACPLSKLAIFSLIVFILAWWKLRRDH